MMNKKMKSKTTLFLKLTAYILINGKASPIYGL